MLGTGGIRVGPPLEDLVSIICQQEKKKKKEKEEKKCLKYYCKRKRKEGLNCFFLMSVGAWCIGSYACHAYIQH